MFKLHETLPHRGLKGARYNALPRAHLARHLDRLRERRDRQGGAGTGS
jgi:hypothetical protein